MEDYDASGQAVGQLVYLPASGQGLRQSEKKHSALYQAVGKLEEFHVPGQAVGHLNDVLFPVKLWESWYTLSVPGQVVGQLKDGSVLGQLVGEFRMIFLCQCRLRNSRRIVLSEVRLRNS